MCDLNKGVVNDIKRMKGTKRDVALVESCFYSFLVFLSNIKKLMSYLLKWRKGGSK